MNNMAQQLKSHWPEYLMEAAELGAFMLSAAVVTALLYHPPSPATRVVTDPVARRLLTGVLMGTTAIPGALALGTAVGRAPEATTSISLDLLARRATSSPATERPHGQQRARGRLGSITTQP